MLIVKKTLSKIIGFFCSLGDGEVNMGFDNIAGETNSKGDINTETVNTVMEQSGKMRRECFFSVFETMIGLF